MALVKQPLAPQREAPRCGGCGKPMIALTALPRVTEPGHVRLFQCQECEIIDFRPED